MWSVVLETIAFESDLATEIRQYVISSGRGMAHWALAVRRVTCETIEGMSAVRLERWLEGLVGMASCTRLMLRFASVDVLTTSL